MSAGYARGGLPQRNYHRMYPRGVPAAPVRFSDLLVSATVENPVTRYHTTWENVMKNEPLTAGQGLGWLVTCLMVVGGMGGIFYCGALAHVSPTRPAGLNVPADADPAKIKALADAYEQTTVVQRSIEYEQPSVYRSPFVLSMAGIGASIGLVVCVIGTLIWRFGE